MCLAIGACTDAEHKLAERSFELRDAIARENKLKLQLDVGRREQLEQTLGPKPDAFIPFEALKRVVD